MDAEKWDNERVRSRWSSAFLVLALLCVDHLWIGALPTWAFGTGMVILVACAVVELMFQMWWGLLVAVMLYGAAMAFAYNHYVVHPKAIEQQSIHKARPGR